MSARFISFWNLPQGFRIFRELHFVNYYHFLWQRGFFHSATINRAFFSDNKRHIPVLFSTIFLIPFVGFLESNPFLPYSKEYRRWFYYCHLHAYTLSISFETCQNMYQTWVMLSKQENKNINVLIIKTSKYWWRYSHEYKYSSFTSRDNKIYVIPKKPPD